MDPSVLARNKLIIALAAAEEKGKVVDVSRFANAKGLRVIAAPKTSRSAKKHVPGLAIVSDNLATYVYAMDLLGPEYARYASEYDRLYTPKIVVTPKIRAANLHTAVAQRNISLVRELLQRGVDVNVQDHKGMTPLHYAAQNQDTEMSELLLAHGALDDIEDQSGHTADFYSKSAALAGILGRTAPMLSTT